MNHYALFIGEAIALPASQTRKLRKHAIDFSRWRIAPIYALRLTKPLEQLKDTTQLSSVQSLLQARPVVAVGDTPDDETAWVLPRPGTISPWTSKAMDIFANTHCTIVADIAAGTLWQGKGLVIDWCYDPMTQALFRHQPNLAAYFDHSAAVGLQSIPGTQEQLLAYATAQGLGLSSEEIAFLANFYRQQQRPATDAELMMFAQANSEHCRHKIFKARWNIDGHKEKNSLFDRIRATTNNNPSQVLSAYSDNAAVMRGATTSRLLVDKDMHYRQHRQDIHICLKAETHNHPTAIAPFEGAATGVGGEIRDEAATGLGAMPKAGWCGFITAHLRLPNLPMPWEKTTVLPPHADAQTIMTEGPMGGANYGNEFGRPNLMGFFRTLETRVEDKYYAYFKPVMLAGGIASIESSRVKKKGFKAGALLLVFGGPALRIGIGGGSASSVSQGSNKAEIDFSSVQRDNPEMQRRCQMVIDACCAQQHNPIASIHDIGAGGLANAFPELVHDCDLGAHIRLEDIPNADSSMSPMEIWCNEAQERYAIAIMDEDIAQFSAFCKRERCPYAIIGKATSEQRLLVTFGKDKVVDMPMQVLFGGLPRMQIQARAQQRSSQVPCYPLSLAEALTKVLACPAVASKEFLVTIADRSITAMVAGEAMIGPWQTPVGDCGLTLDSPLAVSGQAFALGERTPLAIHNPSAASRMAIAEALTNLASCGDLEPDRVILSANWMAAPGTAANNALLYQAVEAASAFCQQLRIAIPVGKDSLSMRSRFRKGKKDIEAEAPVSLVVSALTQIKDVRQRLTPQILPDGALWLIEPARQDHQLGNSALAHICNSFGGDVPDVEAKALIQLLALVRESWPMLSAYHDRSDGGVWACLCEMAFASRSGLIISFHQQNPMEFLLHEGIGVVVQVKPQQESAFARLASAYPDITVQQIASPQPEPRLDITPGDDGALAYSLASLLQQWQSVSESVSLLRDNPQSVRSAIRLTHNVRERLKEKVDFTLLQAPSATTTQPQVAILREQGSNGHRDLAYAFYAAGFKVTDLASEDLRNGYDLSQIQGLVACGGFSYGDVFGGGAGWAAGIAQNPRALEQLQAFWHRSDTFTLGICNGCQMLAQLGEHIPAAQHFAPLAANHSGRFEGRLIQIRIRPSPSVLLAGMEDAQLVVPVAHGYGRFEKLARNALGFVSAVYCDHRGHQTTDYPANPNGSPQATAGISSGDGRVTLLMPHPERRYLAHQCPWQHPQAHLWHDTYSPWFRLFQNARKYTG